MIEKGSVLVLAGGSLGEPMAVLMLHHGDAFGEMAVLGREPVRTATIQALEPTETLMLRRADFEDLRRNKPSIDSFLLESLSEKLRHITEQLVELNEVPATTRIYRRLVDLAEVFGATKDGGEIPITQYHLASLSGAHLRFTNQVINAARKDGLIDTGKRRIVVRDWSRLQGRARSRARS
jgi:CRP-like cAMP-binding protein